ncbi:MAG: hypothetical protein Q4Q06_04605 [Bacteroidota bacterium]|nr:hypothetical protein [Bacteroidota bacterium]
MSIKRIILQTLMSKIEITNRFNQFVRVLQVALLTTTMVTVSAQTPIQSPLTYESLLPAFNRQTPEAASLGKYGSYELNEYNGTPDIRIPLCEAKSGRIGMPLYLYYDASGIKVTQEATFVGLGWNLSYGGHISHIVCGADDFSSHPLVTDSIYGNYLYKIATGYHTDYIPMSYHVKWDIGMGLSNTQQYYSGSAELYKRSQVINDIQNGMHIPDVFQANFCGHNIAFTIDKAKHLVTVLNDDAQKYKIEYVQGQVYPSSFVITDDHGIKYSFSAFDEYDRLDSYYLVRIDDGINKMNIITINYQQIRHAIPYTLYQSVGTLVSSGGAEPAGLSALLGKHSMLVSPSTMLSVNQVYPLTIESCQEKITFTLTNRLDMSSGKAISGITVTSKNGNIKTHDIKFEYGYFEESARNEGKRADLYTGNYISKRLKLNGLTVDDKKYGFSYNEQVALPYKTSLSQDYWGYYNGVNNGDNFCASPKYSSSGSKLTIMKTYGDANRYASISNIQCGMLKRITYPTGGYSDFEYEINHFNAPYYYPNATFQPITHKNIGVNAVAAQTTRPNAESFELKEATDVDFIVNLYIREPNKYKCNAMIKCMHGNNYTESFSTSASEPGMSKHFTRKLQPGVYIISIGLPYISGDYSSTASIRAMIPCESGIDTSIADNSGNSIGGGLRIKSIKNYEGNNGVFLNGVTYEYSNGKLLVPTVDKENITLSYSTSTTGSERQLTFAFIGSQASNPEVMSMGMSTVGYSKVVKKDIDVNGNSNGSTVSCFENNPYEPVGSDMFYYSNYGLNGKLLQKTVLSATNDTIYDVRHTYSTKKYEQILFPKVTSLFMAPMNIEAIHHRLSIYSKANVWNYLSKTVERNFVERKALTPQITTYTYNESNYKEASKSFDNGPQNFKSRKVIKYPMDNASTGASKLVDYHCLAEVTSIENYTGWGQYVLSDGEKYNYALWNGNPLISGLQTVSTDGVWRNDMTVNSYDNYGNIREYTTADNVHVTLLWSYSGQYPVMKIVGATYNEVSNASSIVATINSKTSLTNAELKTLHSAVSNGQVTAYLYNQWYKVSMMIQPNGNTTYYEYDSYGRLITSKNQDLKVINEFKYLYR